MLLVVLVLHARVRCFDLRAFILWFIAEWLDLCVGGWWFPGIAVIGGFGVGCSLAVCCCAFLICCVLDCIVRFWCFDSSCRFVWRFGVRGCLFGVWFAFVVGWRSWFLHVAMVLVFGLVVLPVVWFCAGLRGCWAFVCCWVVYSLRLLWVYD